MVYKCVDRKRHLFDAFPEVDTDDLRSIGLAAARSGWRNYDPSKSAASTFIYRCAWCRISDLARSLSRRLANERDFATNNPRVQEVQHPADLDLYEPEDLAVWLDGLLRTAKRRFTQGGCDNDLITDDTTGESMRRMTGAAVLAMGAKLRLRNDASIACVLSRRPDLLATLDLEQPPSVTLLCTVRRAFAKYSYKCAAGAYHGDETAGGRSDQRRRPQEQRAPRRMVARETRAQAHLFALMKQRRGVLRSRLWGLIRARPAAAH